MEVSSGASMSAVVAYIVLKKKREGKVDAPRRTPIVSAAKRQPALVPDNEENRALYDDYKAKFVASYGSALPNHSSARSVFRMGISTKKNAEPKTMQPLAYEKWREIQKRRQEFQADQARERRNEDRERLMALDLENDLPRGLLPLDPAFLGLNGSHALFLVRAFESHDCPLLVSALDVVFDVPDSYDSSSQGFMKGTTKNGAMAVMMPAVWRVACPLLSSKQLKVSAHVLTSSQIPTYERPNAWKSPFEHDTESAFSYSCKLTMLSPMLK